jgi:ubiquinol-cytochrome c reductase cytochrome c1 subunit
MLQRTVFSGLLALGLAAAAHAAEEGGHVTDYAFSFEGPFGSFDQAQLQRGLQAYTEVCSACHGLKYVAFRTLSGPGGPNLPEDQMRAFAAQWDVEDPLTGEFRPGEPTDHFPESQVENAPDLSLMAKARAGFHGPMGLGLNQLLRGMGGPEYIASMLTGFTGETREEAGVTLYENTAFGGYMAMAPVLYGDDITYEDGTAATAEQIAVDVAAFLTWAAEPKMMVRKQAGLSAVLFLAILAVLLYLTNKQIWAPVKGKGRRT